MRKPSKKAMAIGVGAALVVAGVAVAPTALAQLNQNGPRPISEAHLDDLFGPLEANRRDARAEAVDGVLSGRYTVQQVGSSLVVDLTDASTGTSSGGSSASDTSSRGG